MGGIIDNVVTSQKRVTEILSFYRILLRFSPQQKCNTCLHGPNLRYRVGKAFHGLNFSSRKGSMRYESIFWDGLNKIAKQTNNRKPGASEEGIFVCRE